jgi:hypothetical protein
LTASAADGVPGSAARGECALAALPLHTSTCLHFFCSKLLPLPLVCRIVGRLLLLRATRRSDLVG